MKLLKLVSSLHPLDLARTPGMEDSRLARLVNQCSRKIVHLSTLVATCVPAKVSGHIQAENSPQTFRTSRTEKYVHLFHPLVYFHILCTPTRCIGYAPRHLPHIHNILLTGSLGFLFPSFWACIGGRPGQP